jgi:hypothetical protein
VGWEPGQLVQALTGLACHAEGRAHLALARQRELRQVENVLLPFEKGGTCELTRHRPGWTLIRMRRLRRRPLERDSAHTTRPNADVAIGMSPRSIRHALLAIVAVLTVASAVAQVLKYPLDSPSAHGLVPLVDSDAEGNLPTWYSSLTLLACSLLAGTVALSSQRARSRYAWHWTLLSIVFFLAALDESVALHERVNAWLSSVFDPGGWLYQLWVVPGAVLALALAIAYRPFIAHLPKPVRRLATRGALVFVAAALGLEMIEAKLADSYGERGRFADGLVSVGQEFFEMVGVILFIEALVTYMALKGGTVTLRFGESRASTRDPKPERARPRPPLQKAPPWHAPPAAENEEGTRAEGGASRSSASG